MSRTIKAILPPKRPGTKCTVLYEDGTTKKYLPNVVSEQGLFNGMELSEAEFSELEKAASAASAKARAVRIISAASVSKRDLERRLTQEEYDRVIDHLLELGLEDGFVQELSSSDEKYIPPFDLTGVR